VVVISDTEYSPLITALVFPQTHYDAWKACREETTAALKMASLLSYVPLVNRLVASTKPRWSIDLEPVEVHNVEANADKRPRTLKHLLKANHVNHSIIYHNLQFDNHMPHILCSAYHLGADPQQLYRIYDEEAKELESWKESPSEIVQDDWRDYLGDKRYQRAYVDFFEDALAMKYAYDWKKVVDEYMFKGDEPLINGLIGGRMLRTSSPSTPCALTDSRSRPPPHPPRLRLRV
jgi:hypothetical protein